MMSKFLPMSVAAVGVVALRATMRVPALVAAAGERAGIATKIGSHTFRATDIAADLKNGGTLEKAAAMANHASTLTTQLYDRHRD